MNWLDNVFIGTCAHDLELCVMRVWACEVTFMAEIISWLLDKIWVDLDRRSQKGRVILALQKVLGLMADP